MDRTYVQEAIVLSQKSIDAGGFPAGAVVVLNGEVIAKGISNGMQLKDTTSHGEIAAIREALVKTHKADLSGATIYSSLEPCLMCFSACNWAGVSKIVYACPRQNVSRDYYEGGHSIEEINRKNNRPIELVHFSELEKDAREIIIHWENTKT